MYKLWQSNKHLVKLFRMLYLLLKDERYAVVEPALTLEERKLSILLHMCEQSHSVVRLYGLECFLSHLTSSTIPYNYKTFYVGNLYIFKLAVAS